MHSEVLLGVGVVVGVLEVRLKKDVTAAHQYEVLCVVQQYSVTCTVIWAWCEIPYARTRGVPGIQYSAGSTLYS